MTGAAAVNHDISHIYQNLRHQILSGQFMEGERLPSQSELSREFNIPRHVLRKALERLAKDNLTVSWQGRGTYVRPRYLTYEIGERTRFATNMVRNGCKLDIEVLPLKKPRCAPPEIAYLLGVSSRDVIMSTELVHYVDDIPTALGRHYFDPQRFPDLQDKISQTHSVPKAFSLMGIEDYTRTATFVEARKPAASEAIHLDIPQSQPVMDLRGQNKDLDGNVIEVTQAIVRSDRVKLKI